MRESGSAIPGIVFRRAPNSRIVCSSKLTAHLLPFVQLAVGVVLAIAAISTCLLFPVIACIAGCTALMLGITAALELLRPGSETDQDA